MRLPRVIEYEIYGVDRIYYANSPTEIKTIEHVIRILGDDNSPHAELSQALTRRWFSIKDMSDDGLWMAPSAPQSTRTHQIPFEHMQAVKLEVGTRRESGTDPRPAYLTLEIRWDDYGKRWLVEWAQEEYTRSYLDRVSWSKAKRSAAQKTRRAQISKAQETLDTATRHYRVYEREQSRLAQVNRDKVKLAKLLNGLRVLEREVEAAKAAPLPEMEHGIDLFDVTDLPYCKLPRYLAAIANDKSASNKNHLNMNIIEEIQSTWQCCMNGEWDLCNGVFTILPHDTDRV